jgi:hypothetical protein
MALVARFLVKGTLLGLFMTLYATVMKSRHTVTNDIIELLIHMAHLAVVKFDDCAAQPGQIRQLVTVGAGIHSDIMAAAIGATLMPGFAERRLLAVFRLFMAVFAPLRLWHATSIIVMAVHAIIAGVILVPVMIPAHRGMVAGGAECRVIIFRHVPCAEIRLGRGSVTGTTGSREIFRINAVVVASLTRDLKIINMLRVIKNDLTGRVWKQYANGYNGFLGKANRVADHSHNRQNGGNHSNRKVTFGQSRPALKYGCETLPGSSPYSRIFYSGFAEAIAAPST